MFHFNISKKILFLSTIQQVCIAASTYVILDVTTSINNLSIQRLIIVIYYFTFFIFIAYLFGLINNYFIRKQQNSKWFSYCQKVYSSRVENKNRCHAIDKQEVHNQLITEARDIIVDYLYFKKETYETALNIILNILAIYATIGSFLLFVIIASILFGLLVFFIFKNKIKDLSKTIQETRLSLYLEMSNHIDRTAYVPLLDKKSEINSLQIFFNKFKKPDELYQIIKVLPIFAMITLASILLLTGFKIEFFREVEIILGVIIATPRLVQLFQYASNLFGSGAQYYYYEIRIKRLRDFITNLTHESIEYKKTNIYINDKKFKTIHDIIEYCLSKKTGRFTLRGRNGSGKSTVLHLLKNKYESSILLNPENVDSIAKIKGSTGEKIRTILQHYLKRSNVEVLLLDEWDANLDKESCHTIDALLDKASNERLIIEVRH